MCNLNLVNSTRKFCKIKVLGRTNSLYAYSQIETDKLKVMYMFVLSYWRAFINCETVVSCQIRMSQNLRWLILLFALLTMHAWFPLGQGSLGSQILLAVRESQGKLEILVKARAQFSLLWFVQIFSKDKNSIFLSIIPFSQIFFVSITVF